MSDCISRAEAKEYFRMKQEQSGEETISFTEVLDSLSDFRAVQPSRPHGEWKECIARGSIEYMCLRCLGTQYEKSNFCPNCGADMRGGTK